MFQPCWHPPPTPQTPPLPLWRGGGLVIPPVEWGGVNEQIVSGSSGGGQLEHT